MMAAKFYAHLLLEDEGMDLLFCHRWLLLGFKREFHDLHVLRMWEACWSHYQTEFFHIFISVAIVLEYGDPVWQKSMRVDEMLNYFNNLALEMDGDRVLKQARSLLYQFRRLAGIPCTLRGLLSGPGAWDSATLPEIECTCHETSTCKYSNPHRQGESFSHESTDVSEKQDSDERVLVNTNGRGTDNKPSSDGINSNELNFKERQENGSSNLKDEIPNEEQKLDSSDSKGHENGVESNEFDCEEHQENGTTSLQDETSKEKQNVDSSELNGQNCDDLSPEMNENINLKDENEHEEQTVDTSEQKNDGLSPRKQQNLNESADLNVEIQTEEPKVDNCDWTEHNQVVDLCPEEQQTNDKMCSSVVTISEQVDNRVDATDT
jgi:hypothetical protein